MVADFRAEVKMRRAFEWSRICISKAGSMLVTPALLILIFFALLNSSYSQLPPSTDAPHVGQKAPSFTLPDQDGKPVSLADLLKPDAGGRKSGGLVLIFYRGYW
jgi:cytochrome oxidase Cu insertion factor (SCO1/SenC/PrrC family)